MWTIRCELPRSIRSLTLPVISEAGRALTRCTLAGLWHVCDSSVSAAAAARVPVEGAESGSIVPKLTAVNHATCGAMNCGSVRCQSARR